MSVQGFAESLERQSTMAPVRKMMALSGASKDWSTGGPSLPLGMFPKMCCLIATVFLPGVSSAQTVWRSDKPLKIEPTTFFQDSRITESSGVAVSRRDRGVLYTFNDSGNDPVVFVTNTQGVAVAALQIPGATNVDWEAMALGPCGTVTCIYLGDIGDNLERRERVRVYRFPEPTRDGEGYAPFPAGFRPETLDFRYPDGPHDVEAMLVAPDGALLLISKGRSAGIILFRLPAQDWSLSGPITAESLGRLPIEPDHRAGRLVTDAALAPDGHRVVVRTYGALYFFLLTPEDRLIPGDPPLSCDILGLEVQGEGVDWLDVERLVLTSEKSFLPVGTIHVVQCAH